MDIDDILREVDPSAGTVPFETQDLQALTRLWVAERSAPELLEYASTSFPLPLPSPNTIPHLIPLSYLLPTWFYFY